VRAVTFMIVWILFEFNGKLCLFGAVRYFFSSMVLDLTDIFFCFEFSPIFFVPLESLWFSGSCLHSPPDHFHFS
jgi:hypothetical protein